MYKKTAIERFILWLDDLLCLAAKARWQPKLFSLLLKEKANQPQPETIAAMLHTGLQAIQGSNSTRNPTLQAQAIHNKRYFICQFAWWAYYNKPDPDTLSAYWEMIVDDNTDFWLLGRRNHSVHSILQHLLHSKKFPSPE